MDTITGAVTRDDLEGAPSDYISEELTGRQTTPGKREVQNVVEQLMRDGAVSRCLRGLRRKSERPIALNAAVKAPEKDECEKAVPVCLGWFGRKSERHAVSRTAEVKACEKDDAWEMLLSACLGDLV